MSLNDWSIASVEELLLYQTLYEQHLSNPELVQFQQLHLSVLSDISAELLKRGCVDFSSQSIH